MSHAAAFASHFSPFVNETPLRTANRHVVALVRFQVVRRPGCGWYVAGLVVTRVSTTRRSMAMLVLSTSELSARGSLGTTIVTVPTACFAADVPVAAAVITSANAPSA